MEGRDRFGEAAASARSHAGSPVKRVVSPETSVPTRVHRNLQRAGQKGTLCSAADIVGLQRTAGNRVVSRMIATDLQRQAPPSGGSGSGVAASGLTIDLAHAEKFDGQTLADEPGWKTNKGECATGIQYVFYKAGKPLGKTSTWKQGPKVRGNKIPPGTAIASFRNGKYSNDHAAILIRETKQGLEVWDQFNHPAKAWSRRTLKFSKNKDRSNNGNMFYVIQH